jgi:hypothetical protein
MFGPVLARQFSFGMTATTRLLRQRIGFEPLYADQSETETQDKKEPTREKTKEQKGPAAPDQ